MNKFYQQATFVLLLLISCLSFYQFLEIKNLEKKLNEIDKRLGNIYVNTKYNNKILTKQSKINNYYKINKE